MSRIWLIELDKVEVIDLDLYLMVTIDQIDCDQYNTLLYGDLRLYSCASQDFIVLRLQYVTAKKVLQHTFNLCTLAV